MEKTSQMRRVASALPLSSIGSRRATARTLGRSGTIIAGIASTRPWTALRWRTRSGEIQALSSLTCQRMSALYRVKSKAKLARTSGRTSTSNAGSASIISALMSVLKFTTMSTTLSSKRSAKKRPNWKRDCSRAGEEEDKQVIEKMTLGGVVGWRGRPYSNNCKYQQKVAWALTPIIRPRKRPAIISGLTSRWSAMRLSRKCWRTKREKYLCLRYATTFTPRFSIHHSNMMIFS